MLHDTSARLVHHDETVTYQTAQNGEPSLGYDVPLNSLSGLIVKLALTRGWRAAGAWA